MAMLRLSGAAALAVLLLMGTAERSSAGQIIVPLTGWNQDIIAERTAANPTAGSSTNVSTWVWYETGAPGSTQGLPSSGSITSAYGSNVQFQLQPYTSNNVGLVSSSSPLTMSLTTPGKFSTLQFLGSAQGASGVDWTATLNFSDLTSTVLGPVHDPDWTQNGQNAMTSVGLVTRGATWSGFYSGTLNLFEHDFALSAADQLKTLQSITFNRTSGSGNLMLFALSGNQLAVPEPASLAVWSLLAIGSGACGLTMLRRQRAGKGA